VRLIVQDLDFVFHGTTLEHDILNCAGRKNVFFYLLSI